MREKHERLDEVLVMHQANIDIVEWNDIKDKMEDEAYLNGGVSSYYDTFYSYHKYNDEDIFLLRAMSHDYDDTNYCTVVYNKTRDMIMSHEFELYYDDVKEKGVV